jgi:putative ABC transport system permease protein
MLGHYVLTALRNFWRFRFSTLINVLGLALGLTCFLAAYGAVRYLESSDQHFANSDRTYVITQRLASTKLGIDTGNQTWTPTIMAKYLRADFPQLEAVARESSGGEMSAVGERKDSVHTLFADPELLDIFDLPFLAGDAKNALRRPSSAVVTAKAAERLFGTRDVLGRSVLLANKYNVAITGVIDTIQQPSHLGDSSTNEARFDLIVSYDVHDQILMGSPDGAENAENWLSQNCQTYVLLPKNGTLSPFALAEGLKGFAGRHVPPEQRAIAEVGFGVIPLSQLQLAGFDSVLGIDLTVLVYLVGGLVLLTACLNYANLATAQATLRAKDVGLRRVLGARRGQLVTQYLLEAALLTFAALALAFVLITAAAPVIRSASAIDIVLPLRQNLDVLGMIGVLVGAVTLVAGAYPALVLSRITPLQALRSGKLRVGARFVPTILVGIQFAVTSFLLIAMVVTYFQNRDFRQAAFDRQADPSLAITQDAGQVSFKTLRAELLKHPEIKSVSAVDRLPWIGGNSLGLFQRTPDASAKRVSPVQNRVSADFIDTLDMKLLAGRTFDPARGEDYWVPTADKSKVASLIIDRTLAEKFGWTNPEDAVGQAIFGVEPGKPPSPLRIIGVVESRPLNVTGVGATGSLYMMPDFDSSTTKWTRYPVIRIAKNKIPEALRIIDEVWAKLAPNLAIKRRFTNELFEESYRNFDAINKVLSGLAAFAFVISVMGLFGMAIFVIGRRMHELGIRKTLGASAGSILQLLLRSFSAPVIIANLLVWPLAYFAAQTYLRGFTHRIALTPLPFMLSLIVTVLIAWIAVGAQAWRAARVKPADVLRYE